MAETSPLQGAIEAWLADPDGDVEYAEEVEGRWATRMRQTVRDATTVWWEEGTYTIGAEAYVLPAPPPPATDAYRLALRRNHPTWRVHFALDAEGALVLRGRVAADASFRELDGLLGEIYQMVEISFRPLVSLAFGRREKTP
ncbi:MAG: YbjN domain-containing protein [Actinomycetota bacterium]